MTIVLELDVCFLGPIFVATPLAVQKVALREHGLTWTLIVDAHIYNLAQALHKQWWSGLAIFFI
jgi:hypothetical protein